MNAQRKGRNGERELSSVLQQYGFNVTTGSPLNFGREPDVTGLPGIHIEAKRHERLEIPAWLRQAHRDAERFQDGLPAVFFRQNRQGWAVVMTLEDWVNLYMQTRESAHERGDDS